MKNAAIKKKVRDIGSAVWSVVVPFVKKVRFEIIEILVKLQNSKFALFLYDKKEAFLKWFYSTRIGNLLYTKSRRLKEKLSKFKFFRFVFKHSKKFAIIFPTVAILFLIFGRGDVAAEWWDEGWIYRKAIPVTNNTSDEEDVYVIITTDTSDTDKFQADCGDIRFINKDGNVMKYYIASGCGTASTAIHILFKELKSGLQTIHMYYGNPTAENGGESSGFSTQASDYTIGTIGSEEITDGPVLQWKLDEGYGNTANDSTSQNNDGAIVGAQWQTEGCVSGSCLRFDGYGDYVSKGDTPAIDFSAAESFSMEMWFKHQKQNIGTPVLFAKQSQNSPVSTSTDSAATAESFQRKTWYDGTRYWASFHNATDGRIEFWYSTDGSSWTENTNARISVDTNDFSIKADDSTAYILYKNAANLDSRAASSYPGVGFGWGSASTVFSGYGSSRTYDQSVDGDTIFYTDQSMSWFSSAALNSDQFVIVYNDHDDTNTMAVKIGTLTFTESGPVTVFSDPFTFGSVSGDYMDVISLNDNQFVIVYTDTDTYPNVIAGSVVGRGSAVSVTLSSPVQVYAEYSSDNQIINLDDNTFVVKWYYGTQQHRVRYGEVSSYSGTPSITLGNTTTVNGGSSSFDMHISRLDDMRFVSVYEDGNGSDNGVISVGSVSGSGSGGTISFGTEYVFTTNIIDTLLVTSLSDNKFITFAQESDGSFWYARNRVGSVIGSGADPTIILGSIEDASLFTSNMETNHMETITNDRFHLIYDVSGASGHNEVQATVTGFGEDANISYGSSNIPYQAVDTGILSPNYGVFTFEVDSWFSSVLMFDGTPDDSTAEIDYSDSEYVANSAVTSWNSVAQLNSRKFVYAYSDEGNSNYGTAVIGTVIDTGPSPVIRYSNEFVFNSDTTDEITVDALNETEFVVSYQDGASNVGSAIIGTAVGDGTSAYIVYGSEATYNAVLTNEPWVSALNSSQFIAVYDETNGRALVGTVSGTLAGTSIIYNTEKSFNVGSTSGQVVDCLNSFQFVVGYDDNGNSSHGTARIGTVSGTGFPATISFGPEYEFNTDTTSRLHVEKLAHDQFLVTYQDGGNSNYGTALVGTVADTGASASITYGSETVFNQASVEYISAAAVSPYMFVVGFQDEGASDTGSSLVGHVSGRDGSASVTFETGEFGFNGSDGVNYVSLAPLNATQFVTVYQDTNGSNNYGTASVGDIVFPVANNNAVIEKDTSDKVWAGTTNALGAIKAVQSSSADDVSSWGTATTLDTSSAPSYQLVLAPRSSNNMYAVWKDGADIEGKNYNGSSWDGSPTSIATGLTGDEYNISAVGDSSGNVHLAYVNSSGYTAYQEYNGSWQSAVTLDSNAGNRYVSIGMNEDGANDPYVMWIRGNDIYYSYGVPGYESSYWASPSVLNSSGTNKYLTLGSQDFGTGSMFYTWTAGDSSPYDIEFDRVVFGNNKNSTIDTSTSDQATASPFQRKTWYDGTRYWSAFHSDADNRIEFWYSTDGESWTENTNARLNVDTNDFSVEADDSNAFLSYSNNLEIKSVSASSYPSTSFSWSTAETVMAELADQTYDLTFSDTSNIDTNADWPYLAKINSTQFVSVFRDTSASNYPRVRVGTLDDTSPTLSVTWSSAFSVADYVSFPQICSLNEDQFVVPFFESDYTPHAKVGTVYGRGTDAQVVFSSDFPYNQSFSTSQQSLHCVGLTDTKFVAVYREDVYNGRAVVGEISGKGASATISYGSEYSFETSYLVREPVVAKLSDRQFVISYPVGLTLGVDTDHLARVGTVSGNVLTFGTRAIHTQYFDSSGNDIQTLSPFKFAWTEEDGVVGVGEVYGSGASSTISLGDFYNYSGDSSGIVGHVATFVPDRILFEHDSAEAVMYGVEGTSMTVLSDNITLPVTSIDKGMTVLGPDNVVFTDRDGYANVFSVTSSPRYSSPKTYFSDSSYTANSGGSSSIAVADISSVQTLVAYKDTGQSNIGRAVVGTSSGSMGASYTLYGSEYTFNNAQTNYVSAAALRDTSINPLSGASTVVIAYSDGGNSNYGTAVLGTISGTGPSTVIAFGSEYVFNEATTSDIHVSALSPTKFIIAYKDEGNSDYGTAIVGHVGSALSITYDSEAVFNSAVTNEISVSGLSYKRFALGYQDGGNSNYGTTLMGYLSGTGPTYTLSYGPEVVFNSSGTNSVEVAGLSENQFVTAYEDLGNSGYGTAIIGTIADTSPTSSINFGSEYVFNSDSAPGISIAPLSHTRFAIGYKDSSNSNKLTTVTGDLEGLSGYDEIDFANAVAQDIDASEISLTRLHHEKFIIGFGDNESSNYAKTVIGSLAYPEDFKYPSIAKDSNEKLWIGATSAAGKVYSINSVSSNSIASWNSLSTLTSGNIGTPIATITSGVSGTMYAIWNSGSGISGKYYNGLEWDSSETSIDTGLTGPSNNITVISDSHGDVHLGYIDSNSDVIYKKFNGTWGDSVTLGTGTYDNISMTIDASNSNNLYAFFRDKTNNHVVYSKGTASYSSGDWYSQPRTLVNTPENSWISSGYEDYGTDTVFFTYVGDTTSPYNINFYALDTTSLSNTSSGTKGYKLWMESDGDIKFGVDDDGESFPEYSVESTSANYDDDSWHHVEIVKDGTTSLNMYIDGVLTSSNSSISSLGSIENDGPLYLGVDSDGVSNAFGGLIDEFRIYPYARAKREVKTDYSSRGSTKGIAAIFGAKTGDPQTDSILSGLIGYWDMDESSGNPEDLSDYGRDLLNEGTVTFVEGKFGKAANLSGTDQYLSSAGNFENVQSVSFWVYADANSDPLISFSDTEYIEVSSGTISTTGLDNVSIYMDGASSTSLGTGYWHHVVVTTETPINTTQFSIGKLSSAYFDGKIDDVRLYNRELSPRDVESLYSWSPGPVVYYKLDEGSGTSTVIDSSGNERSGILKGTMTESDWINGKYGKALEFDGSNDYIAVPYTGPVTSISFWVNPQTANEYFVDINGNSYIQTVSGTLSVTGSSTTYVNGIAKNSLNAGVWNHISVVYDSQISTTTLAFGKSSSNYLEGSVDDIRVYSYPITHGQVIEDMNGGHPIGGSPVGSATLHLKFDEGYGTNINNSGATKLGYSETIDYTQGPYDGASALEDTSVGVTGWTFDTYVLTQNNQRAYTNVTRDNSYYIKVTDYGFDIPLDATITGVLVEVDKYTSNDGKTDDNSVVLVKAGTPTGSNYADATLWAEADTNTYTLYGGEGDLWGTSLSPSDVNNTGFGAAFSVYTASVTAYIDHIRATVYYSRTFTYLATATDPSWNIGNLCKVGNCLDFNGSTSNVRVNNMTDVDFDENLASGFTVSTWINADSDGENNTGQIFWKGDNTYLRVDSESSGKLDLEGSLDLGLTDASLNISAPITVGQWHHVAMSYTDDADDEITIWIDGAKAGTSTNGDGSLEADTNDLLIGGTSTANFDGRIDEFKLYATELTPAQIRTEANAGVVAGFGVMGAKDNEGVGGDSPKLWLKMDENSGTSNTNDSSGYGHLGTFFGSMTESDWVPGRYGSGLDLDGSDDYIGVAGTIPSVKTVSFWIKPLDSDDRFIDFDSNTHRIGYIGGTLYASNFPDPTIYVNGKKSISLNPGKWAHITVTDSTGFLADNITVGASSSYRYRGMIDEVKIYDYEMNPAQVSYEYNRGKPTYHYKMNSCEGTTIYNSATDGNGFNIGSHGTLTLGASGITSAGSCSVSDTTAWYNGASGRQGGSIDFDGDDDYIDSNITTNYPSNGSFSVSLWMKPDSVSPASGEVLIADDINSTGWGLSFGDPSSQDLRFYIRGKDTVNLDTTTNPVSSTSTWYNVVAIYDNENSNRYIYVNGELQASDTSDSGTATSDAGDITIGGITTSSNFAGQIDEVKIFNYPLSEKQAKKEFNLGAAGSFE